MTPIFDGQPPQNKAFSNQNKGHLGSRYIYIHTLHTYFGWDMYQKYQQQKQHG